MAFNLNKPSVYDIVLFVLSNYESGDCFTSKDIFDAMNLDNDDILFIALSQMDIIGSLDKIQDSSNFLSSVFSVK